jgi:hypothetical protein
MNHAAALNADMYVLRYAAVGLTVTAERLREWVADSQRRGTLKSGFKPNVDGRQVKRRGHHPERPHLARGPWH